jgi:hypothetical protein
LDRATARRPRGPGRARVRHFRAPPWHWPQDVAERWKRTYIQEEALRLRGVCAEARCVRGGRACDVCATARSSQQLQGHDRSGTGPRSGGAVLYGPIGLSGMCVVCVHRHFYTKYVSPIQTGWAKLRDQRSFLQQLCPAPTCCSFWPGFRAQRQAAAGRDSASSPTGLAHGASSCRRLALACSSAPMTQSPRAGSGFQNPAITTTARAT